jgi:hypothetical protein
MPIYSYPTIYNLGHSAILDIFKDSVIIEEKVDGSQFSFGLPGELSQSENPSLEFRLQCRSKGKQIVLDAPEKMFSRAVESVNERLGLLMPGWIYRCEYLEKPHHNALAYDRIPNGHLIGFDIVTSLEAYMTYEEKKAEFARIGLECVPLLYEGFVDSVDKFMPFLDEVSILGGTKIEGVVVKNYSMFTSEKKVAMGKFVSEKFKEIHDGEWKKSNPTQSDILGELIVRYRTPARWQKAVQHLKEQGLLDNSPRDIGKLIIETQNDTEKECEDEIKDILYRHFMPKVKRGIIAGLPEWYKEELLGNAFETKEG